MKCVLFIVTKVTSGILYKISEQAKEDISEMNEMILTKYNC